MVELSRDAEPGGCSAWQDQRVAADRDKSILLLCWTRAVSLSHKC